MCLRRLSTENPVTGTWVVVTGRVQTILVVNCYCCCCGYYVRFSRPAYANMSPRRCSSSADSLLSSTSEHNYYYCVFTRVRIYIVFNCVTRVNDVSRRRYDYTHVRDGLFVHFSILLCCIEATFSGPRMQRHYCVCVSAPAILFRVEILLRLEHACFKLFLSETHRRS